MEIVFLMIAVGMLGFFAWQGYLYLGRQIKEQLQSGLLNHQQILLEATSKNIIHLQSIIRENFSAFDKQIYDVMDRTHRQMAEQLDKISGSVENRLAKGFEKTNETFTNIAQRLAIIDDAQKKITALSENVVSSQEILTDKRSRGAFGEVQLHTLIQNVLPSQSYSIQHTLSNGNRVDCLLLLPEPTGNVPVDAKFPLENYQKYVDPELEVSLRQQARQQFKLDVRKHIQDVSEKYIVPGETSDGAILFIPAEAIFAEIHAHHPDLVESAWKAKVWLTSPSTMMAILTTACAVLKDSATRKQIHVIQDHLRSLAQDFLKFEERMTKLSRHLQQANEDAVQVHTSAQKISKRFNQIERVELSDELEKTL